jgi:MoxR-like ATPase
LTKFTDETELFVSGLSLFEEGSAMDTTKKKTTRIEKEIRGMLPEHDIAFLDEIFKANSAILNALLTLINERIYFSSDGKPLKSNLISVFAASNERPDPAAGLEALYDRFLIRYYIEYLEGDDFVSLLKLKSNAQLKHPKITKKDILLLREFLDDIQISDDIYNRIRAIKTDLAVRAKMDSNFATIRPSDRRMKNSLNLLKARALLQRRINVTLQDIAEIYPYVLWDTTPNTSSNINQRTLQGLIDMLTKDTTTSIKKFFDYADEIDELKKEVKSLIADVRTAIRNNENDKKETIRKYLERVTRISAQMNTYIKEAEDTASGENLENNEKIYLYSFQKELKDLTNKYTKDMREINAALRYTQEGKK